MLKKILISIIFIICFLLFVFYYLFFTKSGNYILKPFVRDAIQKYYSEDLVLRSFELSLNKLNLNLEYKKFLDITIGGDISLWNQNFDLDISGKSKAVKNAFNIYGKINGGFKQLCVKLSSNIASSISDMVAEFRFGKLARLYMQSRGLEIEDVLLYLGFDSILQGRANLNIDFDTRLEKKSNFRFDFFDIRVPKNLTSVTFFNHLMRSKANGSFDGVLQSDGFFLVNGGFKTPLYAFKLQEAKVTKNFLDASYSIELPSVKNVDKKIKKDFFITGDGKICFDKTFMMNFTTTSLGGNSSIDLNSHNIKIAFEDASFDRILSILGITQDLYGYLDGNFDFTLENGIGKVDANIKNLSLRRNKFFDLVYQYTRFDIQKEQFIQTPLKASFENRKLYIQNLNTRSQNMEIMTKEIILDFKKMWLEAPLKIEIKNSSLDLRVFGLMQSPRVEFKLGDILRLNKKGFLYNLNF